MSEIHTIQVSDKKFGLFIQKKKIQYAILQIAKQINRDYIHQKPLFICVLNGAFMFAADLLKKVTIPCEIAFIRLASYEGIETHGRVKEVHGLLENIENRDVIVIEDIVDKGYTIQFLKNHISFSQVRSIRIATLLFKPSAFLFADQPDYIGIQIPNQFVVGYGLDYNGEGRNLQDIYQII